MAAPQHESGLDMLARECEVLRQERDDLQLELSWNEHTLEGLQGQLRVEHHTHAHAEHRARVLWNLLKTQTRRLRASR